jgi:hypothetical protein
VNTTSETNYLYATNLKFKRRGKRGYGKHENVYICIEQKILLLFAVTSYLPNNNGGCPAQACLG